MNPIDFRGQRSKVKVTMEIYGNKLVKARGCYALRCYIFFYFTVLQQAGRNPTTRNLNKYWTSYTGRFVVIRTGPRTLVVFKTELKVGSECTNGFLVNEHLSSAPVHIFNFTTSIKK